MELTQKTFDSAQKSIELPYRHITEQAGKKFRAKLISAFNYWLQVPRENEEKVQEIIDMLHNASLLIDDIEDGSVLRRGLPVAHLIFGVPTTINSANYFYFKVMKTIFEFTPKDRTNEAMLCFMSRMLELHEGQGIDLWWRDSQVCPTLDEYKRMISLKTTALFGLGLDLLKLFSKKDIDLSRLVQLIGEYFQIRDDYANLKVKEYADQKTAFEDITEGKYSYPVIDAIRKHPENRIVTNILKLKTENLAIKRYLVDYLERIGSLKSTLNEMERLHAEVTKEVARLGGNPHLEALMKIVDLPKDENNN